MIETGSDCFPKCGRGLPTRGVEVRLEVGSSPLIHKKTSSLFLEHFLCLLRACLGKLIILVYKCGPQRPVFLPDVGQGLPDLQSRPLLPRVVCGTHRPLLFKPLCGFSVCPEPVLAKKDTCITRNVAQSRTNKNFPMCLAGAGTEGEGSEVVEHCSNVRRADTLKEKEACGKRHFCAIYTLKRSFCQDRLGTNIGKTQRQQQRNPALT